MPVVIEVRRQRWSGQAAQSDGQVDIAGAGNSLVFAHRHVRDSGRLSHESGGWDGILEHASIGPGDAIVLENVYRIMNQCMRLSS